MLRVSVEPNQFSFDPGWNKLEIYTGVASFLEVLIYGPNMKAVLKLQYKERANARGYQLILSSITNGSETEAGIQSKEKVWDMIHCATVFNSS